MSVAQQMQHHGAQPSADVKKNDSKPGFSKEYLQKVSSGEHPRPLISKEKADELLKKHYSESWSDSKYKNPEGGLTKAGVMAYRRENPGSKLQTAVRTDPSKLKPGSKKAKRRLSFCRRMKGMKKKLTSAKTARDPDSRINKSLRAWNC